MPGSFVWTQVLLLLDGKIVNVEVAVKAPREQLQLGFGVRGRMTLRALGNSSVTGVTHRAVHLGVLAGSLLPFTENLIVTATTCLRIIFFPEGDLKGFVDRVAGHATRKLLSLKVRLVTFGAIRDVSMLVMMTAGAGLLRVLAGSPFKLLGRPTVAIRAHIFYLGDRRRNRGCVRIRVAVQAGGLLIPVRQRMAHGTLGHDLRVIVPKGIVRMEDLVAVLAFEFMPAPAIAQVREMFGMTLSALDGCQGFGGDSIKIRFSGSCRLALRQRKCRQGKTQQNKKSSGK